jgi:hypothetical protein
MSKIANWYYGVIVLVGSNGQTATRRYPLGLAGVGFGETEAAGALDQIRGALVDITDANIRSTSLERVYEVSDELPANADVFEVALVNCHLNAPTQMAKYVTVSVPAPSLAIFQGTTGVERDQVDSADAELVDFVQQLSQHSYISDGEQINTSSGYNGISQASPGRRSTTKVQKKK